MKKQPKKEPRLSNRQGWVAAVALAGLGIIVVSSWPL